MRRTCPDAQIVTAIAEGVYSMTANINGLLAMGFSTAPGAPVVYIEAQSPAQWDQLAKKLGFQPAPTDPDYTTGLATVHNTYTATLQRGEIKVGPVDQATCAKLLQDAQNLNGPASAAPAPAGKKLL